MLYLTEKIQVKAGKASLSEPLIILLVGSHCTSFLVVGSTEQSTSNLSIEIDHSIDLPDYKLKFDFGCFDFHSDTIINLAEAQIIIRVVDDFNQVRHYFHIEFTLTLSAIQIQVSFVVPD